MAKTKTKKPLYKVGDILFSDYTKRYFLITGKTKNLINDYFYIMYILNENKTLTDYSSIMDSNCIQVA